MLIARISFDSAKVIFKEFLFLVVILMFLLFMRFSFGNLFLFYVGFEFTIVPTFLLILG
jgi:NADH:ubiquinone oxidoreductase subunit 4 (subunit M)